MKKWITFLLAAILISTIVLAGCSNKEASQDSLGDETKTVDKGNEDGAKANDPKEKKVEMRIAWWGSQNRHDRTLKVIEMFEDKYPNVSIEPEFSGWDGYWEKIAAQAAASNLPDVFQQDYQYLVQYANKGLLVDLNPYVENGSLDMSNVDENSISGGMADGKLYGVNLGTNSLCIAYDAALFEKAGVPEPTTDWTWEDYMETARKIHEKLGIYGDGNFPGGYFHGLKHYIRQHGQKFYSDDGTKLGYDDDKLFEEFFSMQLELVKEGVLPLPDVRLEVKSPENELIITERAAMTGSLNSNQIIAMVSAANRPIKMTLLPKGKDQVKEGQYLKPSMFFSVSNTTQNPQEAVEFINFFTNDIEANKILLAERGVPISSKVREALMPLLDDTQKQMFDYINLVIENSSPIDPPDPAGHPEIDKLLKTLEQQILYQEITPADAAVKFREEANKILAKSAE